MFIVKAMVYRDYKWNGKELIKTEPYLTNPCGSDYTIIIRDLKTVKGVINRVEKRKWRKDVVEIRVYQCVDVFNEDTHRLVYTIKNFNKMNF